MSINPWETNGPCRKWAVRLGVAGSGRLAEPTRGAVMQKQVSVSPQIHFGKPCVAGTRIPIQSVLELVREGVSAAEIRRDYYPDLSTDDIRACVQYTIDDRV